MKTYQREDHILMVCLKTNTLRLWPENYLVASHNGGHWQMNPDMACPLQTVLIVTSALMDHSVKWSKVDDCKLLSRVTGENVKNYINDPSSMVYVDHMQSIALGVTHK